MTTTIYFGPEKTPIEMPGATSILYAAKRIAESIGLDSDHYWRLHSGGRIIPDDNIIADYDCKTIDFILEGDRNSGR